MIITLQNIVNQCKEITTWAFILIRAPRLISKAKAEKTIQKIFCTLWFKQIRTAKLKSTKVTKAGTTDIALHHL